MVQWQCSQLVNNALLLNWNGRSRCSNGSVNKIKNSIFYKIKDYLEVKWKLKFSTIFRMYIL